MAAKGPSGIRAVWLTVDSEGKIECPYCDKLFLLEGSDAAAKLG